MTRPGREAGATPLWRALRTAPLVSDTSRARERLADLIRSETGVELRPLVRKLKVRRLLLGLADHSPFLWRLIVRDPPRLTRCLEADFDGSLHELIARMAAACDSTQEEAVAMRALRQAKQESALLIALADLGGAKNLIETTRALSLAADAFIGAALRFLLREAHHAGKLKLPSLDAPERGCGLVVLALGKLGANELNYSSDVDLVVFYDPHGPALVGEASPVYVRIAKRLVKLLQEASADSYVLRVDLRLRPDPGSTAIAVSLPAAYSYYETLGQNWERAAYIKARAMAGDLELGRAFLAALMPFIWRKYFDYAALADIHAMKRQIHAVRGHAEVTVPGHDVKLGRGGIREVEFFVQTQQLIFGGKRTNLRGSRTLEMLAELGADGWAPADAVNDLSAAYVVLREVEHRLQMIADEQTQRLPQDAAELARFAHFCGFEREADFESALMRCMGLVSHHYARLFEHAPALDASVGSLVFTGAEHDPETLETLTRLGFKDPSLALETVRGWHFGRRPAVRTARAREVLTELVPSLLQAFSKSGEPDLALAGFDEALAHTPAAVELFSLLKSNRPICELFADILGGAPRLARMIVANPHLLDAAIAPHMFEALTDDAVYRARAALLAQKTEHFEEFLDLLRDFGREEMFRIGLKLFSEAITPLNAGRDYSFLAQAIVAAALDFILRMFAAEHGRVPGGRLVVLGLGRLGAREMTATSDLDLIVIYDFDHANPESDGPHPLHAVQYYTRVAQRLTAALTVATKRGRLYEVDMRLRPSGRQGPLATQFAGFVDYQNNTAETWEHMALTRARAIAGDGALTNEIEQAIRAVLMRRRGDQLAREVGEMRKLIAKVKGDKDRWDLKLASGGLIDIEFIAQYLTLRHAADYPAMISSSTSGMIEAAAELHLIETEDARHLLFAYHVMTSVMQMLRLALDPGADPREASEGVKRRLAAAAELPSLSALEADFRDRRRIVRKIFEKVLMPH
ncbi:bifunctional [glutamine synthetase] adenylyltransferase/[glutamine synthetase]-adenylyl-L-tyrosine phosphorylase [Methylocella silvestris]|uniref:Bifunctional glutamine synthetase adenylyltransferase/adenylyl-removing enzyme n=1 Tax=Methylocella silvestris TaxID=199596 RepID=A0A2J7TKE2_METSI|nr:bifunctional [glutamine synthetase] adenylyltransferase/[glutamine synthetase]-adenylyl-L-tyrosine phosphorylase [Methylocella silvestris]PNG27236.1 bifunctional [glutamate--ammonia ligase]-adenylyl-L-tyrosine phosphorylase/[glutamate--ammonia-ligase] adenylyltransferase [Methylocella silvestris]